MRNIAMSDFKFNLVSGAHRLLLSLLWKLAIPTDKVPRNIALSDSEYNFIPETNRLISSLMWKLIWTTDRVLRNIALSDFKASQVFDKGLAYVAQLAHLRPAVSDVSNEAAGAALHQIIPPEHLLNAK